MELVTRIGIVGAGPLGVSIAALALQSGMSVTLCEPDDGIRETTGSRVARALRRLPGTGTGPTAEGPDLAGDMAALAECDAIVEAVADSLKAKQAVLRQIGEIGRTSAVVMTTTSLLSVTRLAAAIDRPERFAGLHFFNPATSTKLVEVIRGAHTEAKAVESAVALAGAWGKTTIVLQNRPGFLVGRVGRPFTGEAFRLLEEGAEPATVDALLRGMGFQMGPFQTLDQVGIDVDLALTKAIYEGTHGDPRFRPSSRESEMVDAGVLGRKSGKGFYEHAKG